MFETLIAFMENGIEQLWEEEESTLFLADETLSTLRAGELAAAKILATARHEYEMLEAAISDLPAENQTFEQEQCASIYEYLQERQHDMGTLARILVDLSKSRTIIEDQEFYRAIVERS